MNAVSKTSKQAAIKRVRSVTLEERKQFLEELALHIDPFQCKWQELSSRHQSILQLLELDTLLQQDPYQFTKSLLEQLHHK